ncbi:hypothetical protein C0Q70_02103 [Pomacea canaliculata]|uniref:Uncharacterized protein n=1 Tax=Pomacea canaliculata TaxID=400727 RepID=A0A2T7Q1C7_POMCA|nr:hypothetical protein C0Q70_02103 [Pomacea canaliculata]
MRADFVNTRHHTLLYISTGFAQVGLSYGGERQGADDGDQKMIIEKSCLEVVVLDTVRHWTGLEERITIDEHDNIAMALHRYMKQQHPGKPWRSGGGTKVRSQQERNEGPKPREGVRTRPTATYIAVSVDNPDSPHTKGPRVPHLQLVDDQVKGHAVSDNRLVPAADNNKDMEDSTKHQTNTFSIKPTETEKISAKTKKNIPRPKTRAKGVTDRLGWSHAVLTRNGRHDRHDRLQTSPKPDVADTQKFIIPQMKALTLTGNTQPATVPASPRPDNNKGWCP